METAQVVALAAFAVVATGVAFVARRTGSVLRQTRVAEGFRGDVTDLGRRIEQSLSDASSMIDSVRRHEAEPPTLHPSLDAARDAVAHYTQEARDLGGPLAAVAHREALVFELERANRALELVQYGCDLFEMGHRHQRGPEVEIAIKRGYLNLIHARESIADHARAAVEMAEGASPVRRLGRH